MASKLVLLAGLALMGLGSPAAAECAVQCHEGAETWSEDRARLTGLKLEADALEKNRLCVFPGPKSGPVALLAYRKDGSSLRVHWRQGGPATPWTHYDVDLRKLQDEGTRLPRPPEDLTCVAWHDGALYLGDSSIGDGPQQLVRFGPRAFAGPLKEMGGAGLQERDFARGWAYSLRGSYDPANGNGGVEDGLAFDIGLAASPRHDVRIEVFDLRALRRITLFDEKIDNPVPKARRQACLRAVEKFVACADPVGGKHFDPVARNSELVSLLAGGFTRQHEGDTTCPVALVRTSCRMSREDLARLRATGDRLTFTYGERAKTWSVADELAKAD